MRIHYDMADILKKKRCVMLIIVKKTTTILNNPVPHWGVGARFNNYVKDMIYPKLKK